ncbi:DUF1656 domain-containing protein [Pokkaliibacter sp. MBI-7]|uniref:DUF1656 domain-containing protein n=1 Tax=Proteobacteria bacterium 228 TaxID=2083153 RepID=A0A2S5KQG9_9PROT|nr:MULTISPECIES: DUF1656 domain-containing protein [Pokkaliibacter]MDH2433897.1 DUF1656 domain-containing protein [Pokkaliibacter sp. MBI-7]PPC76905.1 hypothetical protein C4K68_12820 [Pokkaliibacter plantistimulans]
MTGESDIYGVFVPSLLVLVVVTYILHRLLGWGLAKTSVYKWVWHPALFDLGRYVVLLWVVDRVLRQGVSL